MPSRSGPRAARQRHFGPRPQGCRLRANGCTAIDILYPATPAGPVIYVLEFSADQSRQNVPGRLSRINAAGREILVDGLITPTALDWDQDAGDIFISELATGRILKTAIR